MADKPTGPAAAAREIVKLRQEWYLGDITLEPDEQVSAFEAIILKHCPDDKAAEKLVEACNKMAGFLIRWKDCLAGLQMTDKDFDDSSGLREAVLSSLTMRRRNEN